ncbi:MAG: hypothetical protein GTN49_10840 [candidate division Zixibacteria bacterium]|nr:hypothetical protein [candidate division Zixibacteria bacterium]
MADNFNISDIPPEAGPKSVEVPGDIADGTAGELLTWDAAGVADVTGPGTAGQVLTSNGAGAKPTFQAGGGGASTFLALTDTPASYAGQAGRIVKVNNAASALEYLTAYTIDRFGANDAIFPATDPAGTINRNDHALLTFPDGVTTDILFEGIVDQFYNFNRSIIVDIHWCAATAVAGAVTWQAFFENLAEGGQDLDVDGFAGGIGGSQTTNATAGVLTYTGLTFSNAAADGIVAGNSYRLRVRRAGTDGGDTMTDTAQLLAVELRMI